MDSEKLITQPSLDEDEAEASADMAIAERALDAAVEFLRKAEIFDRTYPNTFKDGISAAEVRSAISGAYKRICQFKGYIDTDRVLATAFMVLSDDMFFSFESGEVSPYARGSQPMLAFAKWYAAKEMRGHAKLADEFFDGDFPE